MLLVAMLGVACWPSAMAMEIRYVDPGADEPEPIQYGVAVLHPVGDSGVSGTVTFESLGAPPAFDAGLRMTAQVQGLPGERHAIHVHVRGDCRGEDGKRAGTHFNFRGSSREPSGDIERITGNLGELVPGDAGVARLRGEIREARLQGPYSLLGRAVIVHAKGNDPDSPPIGAAGARLACGVIGLSEAEASADRS